MRAALFAALIGTSAAQADPWGTVHVTAGLPTAIEASLSVHLIPYVDIEGGGGGAGFAQASAFVRAGPRLMLNDWRKGADRGLTLRVSALGGFKWLQFATYAQRGIHFGGSIDFTYWLARHAGISVRIYGGGTYAPAQPFRRVQPDFRLGFGFSF